MIHVVELAVVTGSGCTFVQEGSAKELFFDFASPFASSQPTCLKFFVDVVMKANVVGDTISRDTDFSVNETSLHFASLVPLETKILKVVDSGGVNEGGIRSCPTILFTQLTLKGHVVVFGGATSETALE